MTRNTLARPFLAKVRFSIVIAGESNALWSSPKSDVDSKSLLLHIVGAVGAKPAIKEERNMLRKEKVKDPDIHIVDEWYAVHLSSGYFGPWPHDDLNILDRVVRCITHSRC
jgi:hypothetical protein